MDLIIPTKCGQWVVCDLFKPESPRARGRRISRRSSWWCRVSSSKEALSNISLDGKNLEQVYFGLDAPAAESLYAEGMLNQTEALFFMGPVALKYCWTAVAAYFRSEASTGDDVVLNTPYIIKRFTQPPFRADAESLRGVAESVAYVLSEWTKFEGASVSLRSNRTEWERLLDLLVERQSAPPGP